MVKALKSRLEAAIGATLLVLFIVGALIVSEIIPVAPARALFTKDNTPVAIAQTDDSTKLNSTDMARYQEIFDLQAKADWKGANELIEDLDTPVLMGHILAQRYLARTYKSTQQELTIWLENYSDHPQARRIQQIARSRGVKVSNLQKTKKRNLKGFGESFKNTRHESPRIAGVWKSGLKHWQAERFAKAYHAFHSLEGRTQTMGDWDRAAISFWAFRAANELGNDEAAEKHLELAARFPRSFYGAQAIHLLGETLDETVTLRGEKTLYDYLKKIESAETRNGLKRIDALLKVDQMDAARTELLLQYSRAEAKDRPAFVPFVQALNQPALQLRMGVDMERKGVISGHALYPLPKWEPKNGYIVDPALVFAVARQESGFNTKAKSYAGAQGMMQIMPTTAQYIAKKMKVKSKTNLNDPVASINIGQNYLNYLANKSYIRGNVVLLAAAYNAGPGTAKRWAKRPSMTQDPLFFIETLPFNETRDYVMNVMANYWMYREIMNDGDPGVTLLSEGKWPVIQRQSNELTTAGLTWSNEPRS
ncbi:MAG: lytic transglycosylase domain-containing protein [Rickettsiales bacterium]|nr:lytic transglycosylase domain-containing protein [Rickettsiales bacterium]